MSRFLLPMLILIGITAAGIWFMRRGGHGTGVPGGRNLNDEVIAYLRDQRRKQ